MGQEKGVFHMNVIETKNAPGAIGPYSQGYAFGDVRRMSAPSAASLQ